MNEREAESFPRYFLIKKTVLFMHFSIRHVFSSSSF